MIELVIRLAQLRSLRSATGYPFMYIYVLFNKVSGITWHVFQDGGRELTVIIAFVRELVNFSRLVRQNPGFTYHKM